MIKEYLELGQIVGTHGVKGELRVNPRCDSADFAKGFKTVYFNKGEKSVGVNGCRAHGNIILMKLEGTDTIEEASALRGKLLYIRRADASLPEGTVFIEELKGSTVYDDDTGCIYGKITDVSQTGANDVWYITDDNGRDYLIPAIKEVVIRTDLAADAVFIKPLRGIFDDAD